MRLPAAWTGVATLKPRNGRIPLDNPYFGRSAGPLARTVADVALDMHTVARPAERDYTSLPGADIDWFDLDTDVRGRRIAVHIDPGAGTPVDPEVRAAVLQTAGFFVDVGAEAVELPAFIHDGILRDIDDCDASASGAPTSACRTRRRSPCCRTSPTGCTPVPT